MDKSNGKDLFSKTVNTVTEEGAKAVAISKNKLEISTLRKAVSEKERIILDKLYKLINDGKIDKAQFSSEYDSIVKINDEISKLSSDVESIKDNSKLPIRKISGFAKDVATGGKKVIGTVTDKISDKLNSGFRW